MSSRLEREVLEWEEAAARLDGSSVTGSAAPVVRSPSVTAMSGAAAAGAGTAAAGQVLGASTSSSAVSSDYKKMGWPDKFKEEKRLNNEIEEAQKTLDSIPSEKDCLKDLERINTGEAMWRDKKAEMLRKANKPGNFLVHQKYLDEAKRCDQVLNGLQKERAVVEGRLDLRRSTEIELTSLRSQKAELQQVIKEGISSSSTPSGKRNVLGGCTNYVASKRDVSKLFKPGHMNATYRNKNAKASGFDVGRTPVKGSIMVIEADKGMNNGVMNVSDKAGHVAFVGSTKAVKGGYQVTISHAGTKYDANGDYVAGTYINKRTSTVFVPAGN